MNRVYCWEVVTDAGCPDGAGVHALYEEHAPAVWRYALRLTGDRARAEDIVQEVLLRAWKHPNVLDQSESSARAWLFTVARNLVFDEHRSARSQREIRDQLHTRTRCTGQLGRRSRRLDDG